MEKINLGKLVSKALHVPNVDGYPVYGRVDYDLEGRSANWYKKLKESNNSPSNIRRVFITLDGVLLNFYKSVGTLGRNTFVKYDKDLRECVPTNDVGFSSHVLNSFNTEWVLSNIEELYIDKSILLGTEYFSRPISNMVDLLNRYIGEYIDVSKYSRLLMVGYTDDLVSILRNIDFSNLNSIDKHFYTEYSDIVKNMAYMKVSNDLYNKDFTCKTGTYRYDLDHLEERFAMYSNQIRDKYLELHNKNNLDVTITDTESSNECVLELVKGLGSLTSISALHKYLRALTFGLKTEDKEGLVTLMVDNIENGELKDNLMKLKDKL